MSHTPKWKYDSFYEAANIMCFSETDLGAGIFQHGKSLCSLELLCSATAYRSGAGWGNPWSEQNDKDYSASFVLIWKCESAALSWMSTRTGCSWKRNHFSSEDHIVHYQWACRVWLVVCYSTEKYTVLLIYLLCLSHAKCLSYNHL